MKKIICQAACIASIILLFVVAVASDNNALDCGQIAVLLVISLVVFKLAEKIGGLG